MCISKNRSFVHRTDLFVFTFFHSPFPFRNHCFDCSFLSGAQWCIHVSSTVYIDGEAPQNYHKPAVKQLQSRSHDCVFSLLGVDAAHFYCQIVFQNRILWKVFHEITKKVLKYVWIYCLSLKHYHLKATSF